MYARMGRARSVVGAVLILVVCVSVLVSAVGINLLKASVKTVKKDGKMTIDCSNMADGYIMVKAKKSSKKMKLQITTADSKLNYDLNSNGEYEVFPLQYGSGKYQVSLFENAGGKKYSKEGTVKLSVKLNNEQGSFLYPNQYVNYDDKTECVKHAQELCKGMTEQKDIYSAVCRFVTGNFVYDFSKSWSVKPGQLPEIDDCWKGKMGICQDLSAMTCAMLRSQGVPARLMIGTVNASTYHAWVVAVVDGKEKFFDPTAELNGGVSKSSTYTTERYY